MGMGGLSNHRMMRAAGNSDQWESTYADLGGPDCRTAEQNREYKHKITQRKNRLLLCFAGILCTAFCSVFVYVECGENGGWGVGNCDCDDNIIGDRCEHDCRCSSHGTQMNIDSARAAGSCDDGTCADCSDDYIGEFCQLAPAYIISGAVDDKYDGRYERLGAECGNAISYYTQRVRHSENVRYFCTSLTTSTRLNRTGE